MESNLLSPIDLSLAHSVPLFLPKLVRTNFDQPAACTRITNNGWTVVFSGKWGKVRPFLAGGPFKETYVFSSLHFHWAESDECGSEHTAEGQEFPLEMHVVYFKTKYKVFEEAIKYDDGVVYEVYFFYIQPYENTNISEIAKNLSSISRAGTSAEIRGTSLSSLFQPFTSDYLLYAGRIIAQKGGHKVIWLISRRPTGISHGQMIGFRTLCGKDGRSLLRNFHHLYELGNRKIYHINMSEYLIGAVYPYPRGFTREGSKLHIQFRKISVKSEIITGTNGKDVGVSAKPRQWTCSTKKEYKTFRGLQSKQLDSHFNVPTRTISEDSLFSEVTQLCPKCTVQGDCCMECKRKRNALTRRNIPNDEINTTDAELMDLTFSSFQRTTDIDHAKFPSRTRSNALQGLFRNLPGKYKIKQNQESFRYPDYNLASQDKEEEKGAKNRIINTKIATDDGYLEDHDITSGMCSHDNVSIFTKVPGRQKDASTTMFTEVSPHFRSSDSSVKHPKSRFSLKHCLDEGNQCRLQANTVSSQGLDSFMWGYPHEKGKVETKEKSKLTAVMGEKPSEKGKKKINTHQHEKKHTNKTRATGKEKTKKVKSKAGDKYAPFYGEYNTNIESIGKKLKNKHNVAKGDFFGNSQEFSDKSYELLNKQWPRERGKLSWIKNDLPPTASVSSYNNPLKINEQSISKHRSGTHEESYKRKSKGNKNKGQQLIETKGALHETNNNESFIVSFLSAVKDILQYPITTIMRSRLCDSKENVSNKRKKNRDQHKK